MTDLALPVTDHPLARRNKRQLVVRAGMESLESALYEGVSSGDMEQTVFNGSSEEGDDQADHFFSGGIYGRGLLIPEGTTVVGKVWKRDRMVVIAQGKCTFVNESRKKTVSAPWVGEFKAGSKTAVYAHTDTYWVALAITDETESLDAADALTCDTYEEFHRYLEQENDL